MAAHWWTGYPWRMIQTNLREIDMLDIDAEEYVRQLQSFDANVVLINTGGIIASYPTQVEDHFQSPFLLGDSLRQIMEACRSAGIRVIARTDFSKVRQSVYEKHPDWAYRTKTGEIVNYNGDVHVCLCGGYQQRKAFEIIREITETLPIDGLFINMGGFQVRDYSYRYHGICHCENCRREFSDRFGLSLPAEENMADPVFRKYKLFQSQITGEYRERLEKTIHGINPEIVIDNIDFTRMESNTEYKRPLPFWQYSASSNTRALRGLTKRMVSSNTSVDFIGFFYRHVAVNAAEQELRLWQDLANFGGLDYYLIGRLDNHEDRTAFESVRRVFSFAREHEKDYLQVASVAQALLVRGYRWDVVPEERGWIRALTEAHIPFDEVHVSAVRPEDTLDKYRAVILPETLCVSDWFAEKLDDYAARGGTVIASGLTGRYDGNYDIPGKYPLSCMGVKKIRSVRDDMVSAMLHVEPSDLSLFPSYDNDRVLYFGDTFVFADYEEEAKGFLRLIPPHPFGPPERCYYQQITDIAGVHIHPYGQGRGVMIPWNPGLLYYRDGYDNTFRFMRDLLVHGAGLSTLEDRPFTPMVEVTFGREREGSHTLVQLVNGTGHFGTSYLPPVPVRGICLRVPCPEKPLSLTSQTTGQDIPFVWENGTVRFSVNVDHFFEGVMIRHGR